MKVFVVGPFTGYSRAILDLELVDNIEEAEVVLFTGGEDINPDLYHCKKHESTYFSKRRDNFEIEMWKKIRPDQIAFGICRGAQLFCALFGGKLVQDVSNHCGCSHFITNGSDRYEITSIHHQMLYPFDLDHSVYDILFWSESKRSRYYEGDQIDKDKISCEPEIVLFHKEGLPIALGVQGHPEMIPNSEITKVINKILTDLNGKLHNRG